MIDMISKGRLVSGFVRGGGQEQLATGVNPAFNRERFEEAHDLVVAAWSRQGPFRWEGTHYQHRVVNPWAVPLQKPYPRVWIPGVLSAARRSSGRRSSATRISPSTPRSRRPRRSGNCTTRWPPKSAIPPARRTTATCSRCTSPTAKRRPSRTPASSSGCRASSPAWRIRCGRARPAISRPSIGATLSSSRSAVRSALAGGRPSSSRSPTAAVLRHAEDGHSQAAPDPRRNPAEHLRHWGNDGSVSNEDARTCIRLMGQEVMPAMREIGKELGLNHPFELNAPVHLKYSTDLKQMPQAAE